jgi:hypothetical protein
MCRKLRQTLNGYDVALTSTASNSPCHQRFGCPKTPRVVDFFEMAELVGVGVDLRASGFDVIFID